MMTAKVTQNVSGMIVSTPVRQVAAKPASRRHPQVRAQVRRKRLMRAARELLSKHRLDELSLPTIAREAEIAPSSTYHFFKDIYELYRELAIVIATEMVGLVPGQLDVENWEDVVELYLQSAAKFFNGDPAALQLILGELTTPDIKRAACRGDAPFGKELHQTIDRYFVVPHIADADGVFFRTIQIADLIFCLSVSEHGKITPAMFEEAVRAACAYLAIYLPRHLSPRLAGTREATPAPHLDEARELELPATVTAGE